MLPLTSTERETATCHHCGSTYYREVSIVGRSKHFCDLGCKAAWTRKRARGRWKQTPAGKAQDLLRRTFRRGSPDGEAVRPEDIFDRDSWKCQMCHKRVHPSGSGLAIRDATLDHILPVSRGGKHVPSNLQTACRSCNSRKHANIKGQYRLF
jgi:5-methylcytosine-specific restriction endonuclease McrA